MLEDCTPREAGYMPLASCPEPLILAVALLDLLPVAGAGDCNPVAEGDLEVATALLAEDGELFADEVVEDIEGGKGIEGYPKASTRIPR